MTDTSGPTPSPGRVTTARDLLGRLHDYRSRFVDAGDGYDGTSRRAAHLEEVMAHYSAFVTDEHHAAPFAELEQDHPAATKDLVQDLRAQSARCAAVMEKYRALRLLAGHARSVGYFAEVESCIEEEFGTLSPTQDATVLLVGSGSYPMTLLTVAQRTGARAAGVDIDAEAVELGRRVVATLGDTLDITLTDDPVEDLPLTRHATHVVFSSTVAAKYDLLHRMHPVTRDDVVVAMRFGDGLKSLFNYPMQEVDPTRWRLVRTVRRPDQVFDIAVYVKAHRGSEVR